MKILFAIALLFFLIACSDKTATGDRSSKDSSIAKRTQAAPVFSGCSFSNKELSLEIDSCSCSDIQAASDTIFISLNRMDGGEIQGQLLKIKHPVCDSSFYLLMNHQNRYCCSSMGPDPVLSDWILYNSTLDTIRFDRNRRGFYIDTISQEEQSKFPKFDTLDFYKAYKRSVGENLNLDYVPGISKELLYRQYKDYKNNVGDILADSYPELYRIILVVKQNNSTKGVIVFTYWHIG